MSKPSPAQRSLAWLRERGYYAEITEHWNPFARIRQDLLGIGDILALNPQDGPPLLVQTTTTGNLSKRVDKARAEHRLRLWLACGCRFVCHGWALRGARGRKKTWEVAIRELNLADLETATVADEAIPDERPKEPNQ